MKGIYWWKLQIQACLDASILFYFFFVYLWRGGGGHTCTQSIHFRDITIIRKVLQILTHTQVVKNDSFKHQKLGFFNHKKKRMNLKQLTQLVLYILISLERAISGKKKNNESCYNMWFKLRTIPRCYVLK